MPKIYIYIFVMFIVTLLMRELPLFLFRKKIKNKFINSFLYYVPYVTLSVMTFPAILHAPNAKTAGLAAFIVGVIVAYFKDNLIIVSSVVCFTVLLVERVM